MMNRRQLLGAGAAAAAAAILGPSTPPALATALTPPPAPPVVPLAVTREGQRLNMAHAIGRFRWWYAEHLHRNSHGERMRFSPDDGPFLRDGRFVACRDLVNLYRSVGPYPIVTGPVRCGKTELLLCDAIASALHGLHVAFVVPTWEQREKFLRCRIEPMMAQFCVDYGKRSAAVATVGLRTGGGIRWRTGAGSITYVDSETYRNGSSDPFDKLVVDGWRLSLWREGLVTLYDRMLASPYRFVTRVP